MNVGFLSLLLLYILDILVLKKKKSSLNLEFTFSWASYIFYLLAQVPQQKEKEQNWA